MTSKPSRSEIENALSGRTNRARAKPRRAPQSINFDFEVSPRRQQVIGGDLTGVSKRPKYGIFSRYAEVSVANWIAGLIVLLIVGAFFWPQGGESIREIAEQQAQQTDQSIYTESRVEEVDGPTSAEPNLTFSRDNDIDRAAEFREADELKIKVRGLLVTAEQLLASGAYTQPADNNASSVFKQILRLDSGNISAKQGLDKINDLLLTGGLEQLNKDDKTKAEEILAKLAIVDNSSENYQELSGSIDAWEARKAIENLLARAETARNKQNLILPARKNALYFYNQVLDADENNAQALAGIKSIADNYIDRANESMLKGQFKAATGHLATVNIIDSKHPSIPLMEALIANAEPIVRQAAEDANKDTNKSSQASSNVSDQDEPNITKQANSDISEASPSNQATSTTASTAAKADQSRPINSVSDSRTPIKEAGEQATFDREYLKRGLDAYYAGDYTTSAALLQPLADKGVSRAQFRIGYMHFLGRGFKKDRKEADRVIRAALPAIQKFANDGRTWAQSDLGSLYEDGLVLPRNYTEAVYWYRSAAEKGYPGAQTNLGIMYALGRGVTSNRRTAVEWFQRAAKQGDSVAKRNLEALGLKQ